MKKLSFKISTWEEIDIPDHLEKEIISKVKSKELLTSQNVFDFCEEKEVEVDVKVNFDYIETLSVGHIENGATATIEENDVVVWSNSEGDV